MPIEFLQLFGGNPIFLMNPRASCLHRKLSQIITIDEEPQHKACSTVARVPAARDLEVAYSSFRTG